MPEVLETPAVVEEAKPETPSELFARLKALKVAAATPEAIAAKATADKLIADKAAKDAAEAATRAAAPGAPEKRASGDERKFKKIRTELDREIGALRQQIEDLKAGKPGAAAAKAAPVAGAAPKREDFPAGAAGDELFSDAKTQHKVDAALAKEKLETLNAAERKAVIDGYNDRMAKAPEKYPDWDEVLAAAAANPEGQALKGDLGKECPILFMAIARSKHNDDCFYEWLKDPSKLQGLIDIYKSGPNGPMEARDEFLRFEGRVGRAAKANEEAKPGKKADDAAAAAKLKPKPSAEAQVRGGSPAPDGKPSVLLPGTNMLNPAYTAWKKQQAGTN